MLKLGFHFHLKSRSQITYTASWISTRYGVVSEFDVLDIPNRCKTVHRHL